MANPRKFSEKIALQQQKQAEETAAFERIMREVSDATAKVSRTSNLVAPSSGGLGQFKAGSLPNVSGPINNNNNINHNSNNNSKEQKTKINKKQTDDNGSPIQQFNPISIPLVHDTQINNFNKETGNSKNSNNSSSTVRESRGRSVGVGPMRRPGDRKIDTSPYNSGNTAYLSPPSDTSWRRTSSDSAIHQSLVQNQDHHHCHHNSPSPLTLSPQSRRAHNHHNHHTNSTNMKNFSNDQNNHNSIGLADGRPRSSCGLSRLPGINIYPSAHDNSIQIPIGNNTGSLPDLTSVHFPSPMHTPIDQEHEHSSSPFSSSPLTASPSTLSPTAMPTRYPNNVKFHYSPANSPGDNSNSYSPTQTQHASQRNLLSVPVSNSYLHGNKNITNSIDHSHTQSSQIRTYDHNQVGYQHSPPNSALHGSHGTINNLNQTPLTGYRSPQCRPSPGSSPGLIHSIVNNGDSNPSAPCSPAPTPLGSNGQNYESFTNDGYILNHSPIQQQFEQFSLDWATLLQSLVESGCTWTAQVQVDTPSSDYITHSPNSTSYSTFENSTFTHLGAINLDDLNSQNNVINSVNSPNINLSNINNTLNSNSMQNNLNSQQSQQQQQQQQQHSQTQSQQQQQQQQQQQHTQMHQNQLITNAQTPNTPNSIPEIIFTDFSSNGNEFSKDLFQDSMRTLDLELGTMDFVGYQMLSDPTLITDSRTEDSFREDLDET